MTRHIINIIAITGLVLLGGEWALKIYRASVPPTDWLEVRSVFVYPGTVGQPPLMSVERTIKKSFYGEWSATVLKPASNGLIVECPSIGAGEYTVDSKYPEVLTLDSWTAPVKCNLAAGAYRLDTVWTVKVPGYPEKYVSVSSNLFTVNPKE